jgi:hypothetical protein
MTRAAWYKLAGLSLVLAATGAYLGVRYHAQTNYNAQDNIDAKAKELTKAHGGQGYEVFSDGRYLVILVRVEVGGKALMSDDPLYPWVKLFVYDMVDRRPVSHFGKAIVAYRKHYCRTRRDDIRHSLTGHHLKFIQQSLDRDFRGLSLITPTGGLALNIAVGGKAMMALFDPSGLSLALNAVDGAVAVKEIEIGQDRARMIYKDILRGLRDRYDRTCAPFEAARSVLENSETIDRGMLLWKGGMSMKSLLDAAKLYNLADQYKILIALADSKQLTSAAELMAKHVHVNQWVGHLKTATALARWLVSLGTVQETRVLAAQCEVHVRAASGHLDELRFCDLAGGDVEKYMVDIYSAYENLAVAYSLSAALIEAAYGTPLAVLLEHVYDCIIRKEGNKVPDWVEQRRRKAEELNDVRIECQTRLGLFELHLAESIAEVAGFEVDLSGKRILLYAEGGSSLNIFGNPVPNTRAVHVTVTNISKDPILIFGHPEGLPGPTKLFSDLNFIERYPGIRPDDMDRLFSDTFRCYRLFANRWRADRAAWNAVTVGMWVSKKPEARSFWVLMHGQTLELVSDLHPLPRFQAGEKVITVCENVAKEEHVEQEAVLP